MKVFLSSTYVDLPEVAEEGAEEYLRTLVSETSLAPVLERDVETVARTLRRRDPRHAKRFLNDLSLRLGLLANTGKLGDGADQVTEGDVVSWHLLREAASAEKWAYLTRHRGHLIGLLNVYESSREALDKGQGAASLVSTVSRETCSSISGRHPSQPFVRSHRRRPRISGRSARGLKFLAGLFRWGRPISRMRSPCTRRGSAHSRSRAIR